MDQDLVLPETPPAQRALSQFPRALSQFSHTDASPLNCSPETATKLRTLKRKASQSLNQESPRQAKAFLVWRLACVKDQIAVSQCWQQCLKESRRTSPYDVSFNEKENIQAEISQAEDIEIDLMQEQLLLLKQNKFLEEDITDSVLPTEEAYIKELYTSVRMASREGSKDRLLKQPRLKQNKFSEKVVDYYQAQRVNEAGESLRWCCVLGLWIGSRYTKCAHIVPMSFDTKELGYMFGASDTALTSERNGLVLHHNIEKAFDNAWVTIVPYESISQNLTEWRIVVLNDKVLNDVFYVVEDSAGKILWRWKDLDGRKLQFLNDNRPARRYLYFRHAMSYIYAERQGYTDFQVKVPAGRIWASPDKPKGYIRSSILRPLARSIGDTELPEELVDAGAFDDTEPQTSNPVNDELALLQLSLQIKTGKALGTEGGVETDEEQEGVETDEEEEQEEVD